MLNCNHNQLTSLDVSGNPKLIDLGCSQNQLTSLDLRGIPSLGFLDCRENQYAVADQSEMQNVMPGLDMSRVSNVTGGTMDNGIIAFDDNSDTITYQYQCSDTTQGEFCLTRRTGSFLVPNVGDGEILVYNSTESSCILTTASYDSRGRMLGVQFRDIPAGTFAMPVAVDKNMQAFLTDGSSTPLCETVQLP